MICVILYDRLQIANSPWFVYVYIGAVEGMLIFKLMQRY